MIKKIINILPEKWLDRLIKIGYETEDLEVEFGWWNENDHNCWCDLVFTVSTNEDCTIIDEYSFKYREKYVNEDEWYYDIDETALKCINELTAMFNSLKAPEIIPTVTIGHVKATPIGVAPCVEDITGTTRVDYDYILNHTYKVVNTNTSDPKV